MMNNIRDYPLQVTVGRPAVRRHGQKQLVIFTADGLESSSIGEVCGPHEVIWFPGEADKKP